MTNATANVFQLTNATDDLLKMMNGTVDFFKMNMTADAVREEFKYILYWALNYYGVTLVYLLVNIATAIIGLIVILFNALIVETMIYDEIPATGYSNFIIASMATSDMLSGFSAIHTMVFNIINYQSKVECYARLAFMHFFFLSSILHLFFLTANRYFKIVIPRKYSFFLKKENVVGVSSIIWIVSLVYAIIPAVGFHKDEHFTAVLCRSYIFMMADDYIILTLVMFFGPLIIMNLMYVHIFCAATKQHKQIRFETGFKHRKSIQSLTGTFIISSVTYTLCWLPFGIILGLSLFGYFQGLTHHKLNYIIVYSQTCAFCHALFNPVIYAFKLPAVKSFFKCCVSCQCCDR